MFTPSNESSRGEFALHLPGLLKVLAEHLYSNRQVALRELIQNAGDSTVRRADSSVAPPDYRPRLTIALHEAARTLTFADSGSGLSRDEIRDYLSTIGRSYTRELKEHMALFSPDAAQKLVGQFGFGFLSAFLLAERVEVDTLSMNGGAALHWESSGDESYELAPGTRAEVGTTITLHVKPEAAYLLDAEILRESLLRFADFLPFAIYMDGDDAPLNRGRAPWEGDEDEELNDWIRERSGISPLAVIGLSPHRIELGHDALEIPLGGALWVPPGSVASVREYGDLSVYIRGMWIRDDEKQLLPKWARFVRGVIDCPALQPTASREDVHQDETFGHVKAALEAQLAGALENIAREAPEVWAALVRGHADVITGWAARDEEFFERVAEILPFRTTRGLLTLRDYLAQSGGKFYYVSRELGSLQEQLLAEGSGVPVVDASWFGVEGCLRRFATTRSEDGERIPLVQMDEGSEELLRPVAPAPFAAMVDYFAGQNQRARAAAFEPSSVPALLIYPRDAQFVADAKGALSGDELASPFAQMIGQVVENTGLDADDLRGVLHLNADNPLIRSLARAAIGPREAAILDVLAANARLFAAKTLTAGDAARVFGEFSHALGELQS